MTKFGRLKVNWRFTAVDDHSSHIIAEYFIWNYALCCLRITLYDYNHWNKLSTRRKLIYKCKQHGSRTEITAPTAVWSSVINRQAKMGESTFFPAHFQIRGIALEHSKLVNICEQWQYQCICGKTAIIYYKFVIFSKV